MSNRRQREHRTKRAPHQNGKRVTSSTPDASPSPETKSVCNDPVVSDPLSWTPEFCDTQMHLCPDDRDDLISMWQSRRRTLIMYREILKQGREIRHPFTGLRVDELGVAKTTHVLKLTDIEKLSLIGIEP